MLSVWVVASPTSEIQWWDISYSLESISISTHERGFLECVLGLNVDPSVARAMLAGGGTPRVYVTDDGAPVWDGRIERVGRVDGNAVLYARGFYSSLSDRTHTAIYAMSNAGAFKPLEYSLNTAFKPMFWDLRLYESGLFITPRKGETHGGSVNAGGLYYVMPFGGYNYIYSVTFTYAFYAPAGWNAFVRSSVYNANAAFSSDSADWALAGTGALQTGTVTQVLAANKTVVTFGMNDTNVAAALGVDTGTYYFKVTNITVNGVSSSPTTTQVVAGAVGQVAAQNPGQINSSTIMVTASETVTDIVCSNTDVQDVLAECASMGDGSNNPVEYGVFDDKTLFYQTRGTNARTWYTDETGFEVERGFEDVWNSIRVMYTDVFGNAVGSSVAEDALSIAYWGIYRARRYESGVTKSTAADDVANTTIEKSAAVVPSIRGALTHVFDRSGVAFNLYAIRSGDILVVRSLEYGDAADTFNGFRISKTKYTAGVNRESLTIELESANASSSAFINAAATPVKTVVRPPIGNPNPGVGVGGPPPSRG